MDSQHSIKYVCFIKFQCFIEHGIDTIKVRAAVFINLKNSSLEFIYVKMPNQRVLSMSNNYLLTYNWQKKSSNIRAVKERSRRIWLV